MAGAPATDSAAAATGTAAVPLDDAVAGAGCWEDAAISLGLVGVQLASAAYMVVLTPVLELGLDPLFLIAFGSLCTGILTVPFAVKLESKKWPSELTSRLFFRFVVLALGGVTGFQALMLQGMKMTSPAIASAMPNLAPGFIFVISGCLGFERVDLKCRYTRAKILGTVVCLGGAVAMSFLQSPDARSGHVLPRSPDHAASWVVGCVCLLAAVLVLSGTIVMQAATMLRFQAPFTLCSVTSLIGAALTAAFRVATSGRLSPGTLQISLQIVLSLVFLGGVVSSACIMFQTWALEKKGPVMVSMFNPMQTVGTVIFSVLFLGSAMQLGSILGMVFLFSGLHIVLWAKNKECQVLADAAGRMEKSKTAHNDMEKQLLF
ncbi:WAT1-related protein At5g47470 [Sorghum bicolor]|uniref:WAT1-related protein n=1 Tax=Sorghum bicolor TaxID=4558 RepID=A0A1B6QE83_SORBI|nr:WAT1-related protein At5g47470 [Sorghum bicolor]KXG36234.1 hypothetical protein SORBI_3002G304300 [Sorghum bicolor]|eukprot:XP_021310390.1 WAT1-related protein At5g47470 [Sorghum bicolor]